MTDEPSAPNPVPSAVEGQRSFSLNSPEFYEALTDPRERPWIPNGALATEARVRERAVVVERFGEQLTLSTTLK